MIDRVEDLSVPMQRISYLASEEAKRRFRIGGADVPEGPWTPKAETSKHRDKPLGTGEHGGLEKTIRPFWSYKNAGWATRAPHAHLFSGGTMRYFVRGERVSVWSAGKGVITRGKNKGKVRSRHRTKGKSAELLSKSRGRWHQPMRPFDFLSDALIERAPEIILDYVVGESE
ncbi:MAG TPA: hypothetical protein VNL91_04155 [Thermoanaerobaculia bacterium]|nr:hypothetical protein [Thermoanaerobaculia bacterium]